MANVCQFIASISAFVFSQKEEKESRKYAHEKKKEKTGRWGMRLIATRCVEKREEAALCLLAQFLKLHRV